MDTTIRIRSEDKKRLLRIQSAWHRARSERPSQQDLLSKTLEYTEDHLQDFIETRAWRPWTPAEIEAFEAETKALGGWEPAPDIDDAVYGRDYGDEA